MRFTKLEKHLYLKTAFIAIKWCACLALIVYACFRLFIVAVLIVSLWLVFTSFGCCENGYIPRYHYLFRFRFSHSYQERLELNAQHESGRYVRVGECIFLEDYLIFTDFGVILHYSEVKNITLSQKSNLHVVTVYLQNGKKYRFNISEPEYKGYPSLFSKAIQHYESKKETEKL